LEADELEHLVRARLRDPGGHADHAEVVSPGAPRVEALCREHGPRLVHGLDEVAELLPVDRRVARGGADEAEERPERRRLPGAVRADEAGDAAVRGAEGDAVHGNDLPESLAQVVDLDHGARTLAVRAP